MRNWNIQLETHHAYMSNRQQVGEREDNEVVDGRGGKELGHREQRNCSQQVNLRR